jgi:hypothetical protein
MRNHPVAQVPMLAFRIKKDRLVSKLVATPVAFADAA